MDKRHSTKFVFDSGNENYGITPVENAFINIYMPPANGDYVKVYLYGLKHCFSSASVPIDNELLSEELQITEGDVRKAWNYWQEQGILSVSYNSSGRAEVHYFSIPSRILDNYQKHDAPANANDTSPKNEQEAKIQDMFKKIEEMFSATLSVSTMQQLSEYLKDYHFEPETVILLAEYSLNNITAKGSHFTQSQAVRYMNKVADSWQDAGVVTSEDAEVYIAESRTRQKLYYSVLREIGQNRGPMSAERELIDKWFDTYHFKPEIVKAALRRTAKPNLKYVDGILTRWHDAGITTLDAVRQEAADFRQSTGSKGSPQPAADEDTREREDLIDALADQDTQALWSLIDEEESKSRDDH